MNARNSVWGWLFVGTLASACRGGSDAAQMKAPSMMPPAAGGSLSATGSADTGTSSAGGPAANGGSGASGGAALVVLCGSASCTAPMALPAVSPVTPMACCLDAVAGKCGFIVSGTCTPPAPDAPKCPAVMISLGKSCCTADNICGIDSTAFGMGCRDIFPGAKTGCDGTRVPSGGETAGSSAASGGNAAAAGSGAAVGSSGSAAPAGGSRAAAGGDGR